jgi:hypothetical protein
MNTTATNPHRGFTTLEQHISTKGNLPTIEKAKRKMGKGEENNPANP